MIEQQRRVLEQRIRYLQTEIIDRVRTHLSKQSNHQNKNLCEANMKKNISQGNLYEASTGAQLVKQKLMLSPSALTSKQGNRGSTKYESPQRKNKFFSSGSGSTIKKQNHPKENSPNIHASQDLNSWNRQQLIRELSRLKEQNQSFKQHQTRLQYRLEELKQKYESESSSQSESQIDSLMKKIQKMQKKIKCLKCGEEQLETKLSIYRTKNQLLIAALNESQQANYQLKLKVQELAHANSLISQDPKFEDQVTNWEQSQKSISKNLYEALSKLPTLQQPQDDDESNKLLFEPQNQTQIQSILTKLKKFSEQYDSIIECKVTEFKMTINKIFEVFFILVDEYKIDLKYLRKVFQRVGFDGSQGMEISTGLRKLLLPKRKSRILSRQNSLLCDLNSSQNGESLKSS